MPQRIVSTKNRSVSCINAKSATKITRHNNPRQTISWTFILKLWYNSAMNMREERPKSTRSKRQTSQPAVQTSTSRQNMDVVRSGTQALWTDATGNPLLPDEQPVGTVRDSLYDFIPLGARELKLINTPEFLRLQQVKQLGFVYRIWPGATHSRYEHSLGCYHLTVRALRSLLTRGEQGGLEGVATSSIQT